MTEIKVILVEDDDDLRESLAEVLELSGFHVDTVNCAMAFYQTLNIINYDVALVDIGLPDQSGLKIVEFLREKTGLGIILLTAKSAVADRVLGYESGADHYFVKPVDSFELMAAIRSLHGRMRGPLRTVAEMTHWHLERSTWKLVCPEGKYIKLTAKEMTFLNILMQQSGECVARSRLLDELGYFDDEFGNRSMDSLLRRLRKKVKDEIHKELPVQTIRASGYCFSAMSVILSGG